jgi:hypothetical protein
MNCNLFKLFEPKKLHYELWRHFEQIQIYTVYKQDIDMTHIPSINFSNCEKGICYTGLKLLDNQPPSIKSWSHDIKVFKTALKGYLLSYSSYTNIEFVSIKILTYIMCMQKWWWFHLINFCFDSKQMYLFIFDLKSMYWTVVWYT